MTFRVGQKVVFVGCRFSLATWFWELWHPVPGERCRKGCVYTVAAVRPNTIDLVEVYSPEDDYWTAGFRKDCFRPVVERKTDISIFTAMLTGSKIGADA